MGDVNFILHVAREMDAVLKQLPERVAKQVLESAARKGANIITEAVRDRAPLGKEVKGRVRVRTTKKGVLRISNYGKLKLEIKTGKIAHGPASAQMATTVGKAFWGM